MPRVTSVTTPVAHLVGPGKIKIVNGHLAFATEGAGPIRLQSTALRHLFCYGPIGVTDQAMTELFRRDIHTAWFSQQANRCRGRLVRHNPAATSLRMRQHRAALDPEFILRSARLWIALKIDSQIAAVRHAQRHGTPAAAATLSVLNHHRNAVESAGTVDSVRGLEGAAAAAWFQFLPHLLRAPWTFNRRSRRPPRDPVNALLSLGYTLLNGRAVALCEALGLEVYLGTLHEYRPGRPSLACDVIEPLRVPSVDRWVIKLLNRNSLRESDFVERDGGFRLQPAAFNRILASWETEWTQADHEAQLLHLIQEYVATLRVGTLGKGELPDDSPEPEPS